MVNVKVKGPLIYAGKNNISVTKKPNFKDNLYLFIKDDYHYIHIMNTIEWLKKCCIHRGLQFFSDIILGRFIPIISMVVGMLLI